MQPGTYNLKAYQQEFVVATAISVKVTAGQAPIQKIALNVRARNTIWQIGDWVGQPQGLRNADKQLGLHPSDSRMGSWGALTYIMGNSTLHDIGKLPRQRPDLTQFSGNLSPNL